MININEFIINTLSPINVPKSLLIYEGTETTYIVFSEYLQQADSFSEDEEDITSHYIALNLYTKGNNTELVTQIKTLMKNADFKRQSEHDLYEKDTKYFNHVFRFFYSEELLS